MSEANGGPAFPYSGVHKGEKINHIIDSHGMTLRDYFAAKAMGGICAHADNWGLSPMRIAEMSYEMADKMLRARDQ
ncbi:hypothetical protein [Pantoea ananatis]|uniref:hypothetical protein n=1 Tax=Pantoea ananas TaxID=553 RepID=UPI001B307A3D|nr:hypothetical protein [Pantoea ananatis]